MAYWLAWEEPRAVGDLAHVEKFFVRNLGSLTRARTCAGPAREGNSRTPSMYADEKSDEAVVPRKRPGNLRITTIFRRARKGGYGAIGRPLPHLARSAGGTAAHIRQHRSKCGHATHIIDLSTLLPSQRRSAQGRKSCQNREFRRLRDV